MTLPSLPACRSAVRRPRSHFFKIKCLPLLRPLIPPPAELPQRETCLLACLPAVVAPAMQVQNFEVPLDSFTHRWQQGFRIVGHATPRLSCTRRHPQLRKMIQIGEALHLPAPARDEHTTWSRHVGETMRYDPCTLMSMRGEAHARARTAS